MVCLVVVGVVVGGVGVVVVWLAVDAKTSAHKIMIVVVLVVDVDVACGCCWWCVSSDCCQHLRLYDYRY